MTQHAVLKAQILSEAVPYMQEYHDKIVVVKYGGNAMVNEVLIDNVINDVCLMNLVGIHVILVHGVVNGKYLDVSCMRCSQFIEMRKFLHTRSAVCCPQIYDRHLSAVVSEMEL